VELITETSHLYVTSSFVLSRHVLFLVLLLHLHRTTTKHSLYKDNFSILTSCGAKAQQTPSPCRGAHRSIARFLRIDEKCNQVMVTPHLPLKISCKSVQPFSRNLANKETKKHTYKQTKKSIENNTLPPMYWGRGNNTGILSL